ncbi:MAG: thioesterase [Rhodoferax sp.]|nr:thioesterase [Rhodoferax sp.]
MSHSLVTYSGSIQPDWVDYNGHLRDAYYLLLFSFGTDGLMDQLGLDAAGRAETGHSLYTVECHLNFLREVRHASHVEVHTRILGHDAKRLHVYHSLVHPGRDGLLAASEQLLLNVDVSAARTTGFASGVLHRLQVLFSLQRSDPRPEHVGKVIRVPWPVIGGQP